MSIPTETDPMILPLLASLAFADSITLDTGVTIEGDLARYELGGDCQVSVTEGGLVGVILIVPCHRVESFVRTTDRTPVPIGLEEESQRRASGAVAGASVPAQTAGQGAVAAEAPYAVAVEEVGGASLVAAPLAEPVAPRDEPFYDEPLFPVDATTPITHGGAVAATPAPVASAPVASAPAVAAPSAPVPSMPAPSMPVQSAQVPPPAPMETSGPRMAPRMDDPTPPPSPQSRSVSF